MFGFDLIDETSAPSAASAGGGDDGFPTYVDVLGTSTLTGDVLTVPDGNIVAIADAQEWLTEIHLDFRFPTSVPASGYVHVLFGENVAAGDLDGVGGAFSSSGAMFTHLTGTAASPTYTVSSPSSSHTFSDTTRMNVGEWARVNVIANPDNASGYRVLRYVDIPRGRTAVADKAFSTSTQLIQDVSEDADPAPTFTALICNESGQSIELRRCNLGTWNFAS